MDAQEELTNLDNTYRKYWRGKFIDDKDFETVMALWMGGYLKMCVKDGKAYAIDRSKEAEAEIVV